MGKLWLTILLIFSVFTPMKKVVRKEAPKLEVSLHTDAAILIEAQSGRVLFEKNADEKHYPASMTKMMGMYLILDAIEKEKLSFDDEVICSSYASSMGGTQIFLEPNEKMSVKDLFKAVAINSANDAITALGEHLCGSTEGFVKKMNDTAKEMGMKNTHFKNPTGFDDEEHVTTPRDMSIVAQALVKFQEKLFQFTRLKEAYVRENTSSPFWLVNTNKMLGHYEGMDGLKTGYTRLAGYNLTATAMRNHIRLISVVMHEDSIEHRAQDTTALLNAGFSNLENIKLFPMHEELLTYTFLKAKKKDTPIVTKSEINLVVDKGVKVEDLKIKARIEEMNAPLKAGDIVGYLDVEDSYQNVTSYPLTILEDVEMMHFIDYFKDMFLRFLA